MDQELQDSSDGYTEVDKELKKKYPKKKKGDERNLGYVYVCKKQALQHVEKAILEERDCKMLDQKLNLGICFSGGSSRSSCATMGQVRGLRELGAFQKAKYVSCVSGASWMLVPYFYCNNCTEEAFLGTYIPPDKITQEDLEVANGNFLKAVERANVVQRMLKRVGAGHSTYSRAIGDIFLYPFGCGDLNRYFTWRSSTVESICNQNSHLTPEDFFTINDWMDEPPLLIINGMVFRNHMSDMYKRKFLIEFSPFFVGNSVRVSPGLFGSKVSDRIGGGYHEPHIFNSLVDELHVSEPVVYDTHLKISSYAQVRSRFTLSDVIGTAGAAPASELSKMKLNPKINGMPAYKYTCPQKYTVPRGIKSKKIEYGDAGVIDNLGILTLLKRGVTSIISFLNTNRRLYIENPTDKMNCLQEISQDIGLLFGPEIYDRYMKQREIVMNLKSTKSTTKYDNLYPVKLSKYLSRTDYEKNQMFATSDYEPLMSKLVQKSKNGECTSVLTKHMVMENKYHDIAGGWEVEVLWIYLDRCEMFEKQLTENFGIREPKTELTRFPSFNTARENSSSLIGLRPSQTNMLSHFTHWMVLQNKDNINHLIKKETTKFRKSRSSFERRTFSFDEPAFTMTNMCSSEYLQRKVKLEPLFKLIVNYWKGFSDFESTIPSSTLPPLPPSEAHPHYISVPGMKATITKKDRESLYFTLEADGEEKKHFTLEFDERNPVAQESCMRVLCLLNEFWSVHHVKCQAGTYDLYALGDNFMVKQVFFPDADPKPNLRSTVSMSVICFLFGIYSLTKDDYVIQNGQYYITNFSNLCGGTSRLDSIDKMLFIPTHDENIKVDPWFKYWIRCAFDTLPPLKEILACLEHSEQLSSYVETTYKEFRGGDLVKETTNSGMVFMHCPKKQNKAYSFKVLKEISVSEPFSFVICYNIFRVGINGICQVTKSTKPKGWSGIFKAIRATNELAFLISKIGSIYEFNMLTDQTRQVSKAPLVSNWSTTTAISYYEDNLYLIRRGKRHQNLCRMERNGNVVVLSQDSSIWGLVIDGCRWKDKFAFLTEEGVINTYDFKSGQVVRIYQGWLPGYQRIFNFQGNLYLLGRLGVVEILQNSIIRPVSTRNFENVSQIGYFGKNILLVRDGSLWVFDFETDQITCLSLWNENWSKASACF